MYDLINYSVSLFVSHQTINLDLEQIADQIKTLDYLGSYYSTNQLAFSTIHSFEIICTVVCRIMGYHKIQGNPML